MHIRSSWALAFVMFTGCASQPTNTAGPNQGNDQKLIDGVKLITTGAPKKAIDEYLEPIILDCDEQRKNAKGKLYSARSQAEAIIYMALASAVGTDATALSSTCGDAHYFKAYAGVDLGQLELAMKEIEVALDWSPMNSRYLSEQGHLFQLKRQWDRALDSFQQAEGHAELGPESEITSELLRAKRGVGFALIELGRLDEAEAKFKECLAIDKQDKKALHELEYIKQLRNQTKKAS